MFGKKKMKETQTLGPQQGGPCSSGPGRLGKEGGTAKTNLVFVSFDKIC